MGRRQASLPVAVPRDARASTFSIGGTEHMVLSFETGRRTLPENLTDAERSVVCLVLAGLSNEEIARARRRSIHTVTNQIAAVFRKLGVGSRTELQARLARGDR